MRLRDVVRWEVTGRMSHLPKEYGANMLHDPGAVHSHGFERWVYNLMEAAWAIQQREVMTSRQIERLTADTAQWVTGVRKGIERLQSLLDNVRARVLPWLLGEEDPLPAYVDFLQLDSRIAPG